MTVIIASEPALESILNGRSLVTVHLRDGLHLVPLEDDDLDSLGVEFGQPTNGFTHFGHGLAQFCTEHSKYGPLVYLETEYFGGVGDQAAAAFANGSPVPPTPLSGKGAVNAALRCIGVVADSSVDEFDFIGLSRHRNTSDWKEAATS